jgi:hypothetical protein
LALVASISVLALLGRLSNDVAAIFVVIAFATIAIRTTQTDFRHAMKVTRGLKLLTVLAGTWLLFQTIPLPGMELPNSLWFSAGEALQFPLLGRISIDPGNTISNFLSLLLSVILVFTTIFVARDRSQAELVLNCLCFVITFTVVELSIIALGIIPGLNVAASREMLSGIAALGVICNLAACVRIMDRAKSQSGGGTTRVPFAGTKAAISRIGLCVLGVTICSLAVVRLAPTNISFIVCFGVLTFLVVLIVKRSNLTLSSSISLWITAISAIAMIVAWRFSFSLSSPSVLIGFADAPSETLDTVGRMLADSSWAGSGAGTFSALWAIYRPPGAPASTFPPTLSSSILTGGGIPMLTYFVVSSAVLFAILLTGAARRRRDNHYAAAAAASVVVIFCQSFCDASLGTACVSLASGLMIGIGLAQSVGQSEK